MKTLQALHLLQDVGLGCGTRKRCEVLAAVQPGITLGELTSAALAGEDVSKLVKIVEGVQTKEVATALKNPHLCELKSFDEPKPAAPAAAKAQPQAESPGSGDGGEDAATTDAADPEPGIPEKQPASTAARNVDQPPEKKPPTKKKKSSGK